MKHILYILLLLSFGCKASKQLSTQGKRNISKIVFKQYYDVSGEGGRQMQIVQDSLIAELEAEKGIDSLALALAHLSMVDDFRQMPTMEVVIEINQDTIWRYTQDNDNVIGNYYRIGKEDGALHYHATWENRRWYKTIQLFEEPTFYTLQKYPDDRKQINGYDCYKIKINYAEGVEKGLPTSPENSMCEMYVTEDINLPLHTMVKITRYFPNLFPLEIRNWNDKTSGVQEVYEVQLIELK